MIERIYWSPKYAGGSSPRSLPKIPRKSELVHAARRHGQNLLKYGPAKRYLMIYDLDRKTYDEFKRSGDGIMQISLEQSIEWLDVSWADDLCLQIIIKRSKKESIHYLICICDPWIHDTVLKYKGEGGERKILFDDLESEEYKTTPRLATPRNLSIIYELEELLAKGLQVAQNKNDVKAMGSLQALIDLVVIRETVARTVLGLLKT